MSNAVKQSYTSDLLDAIVCGLPAHKRDTWLLSMLNCYTDDSGSSEGRPVFVLAGYVSDVDRWKLFSDEWDIALKSGPRPLEYFKMREANSLKVQFDNWSDAERDAKLTELGQIIEKHVMYTARAVLYWDDYYAIQAKFPNHHVEPYTILFNYVMISAALWKMDLKIDAPIKFIFDIQGDFGLRAAQTFKDAVEMATIPSFFQKHIAGPPNFEDDKDFLPLQSADLIAWQIRRFCYDNFASRQLHTEYPFKPPLGFLDSIPGRPTKVLDVRELEDLFSIWKYQYPLGIR